MIELHHFQPQFFLVVSVLETLVHDTYCQGFEVPDRQNKIRNIKKLPREGKNGTRLKEKATKSSNTKLVIEFAKCLLSNIVGKDLIVY